jgi:hypothetical protein
LLPMGMNTPMSMPLLCDGWAGVSLTG